MKLKNKEVQKVVSAILNLGNRNSLKKRWELVKYSQPFITANDIINKEINLIIEKEGGEDKSITPDNEHYLELMNLEINIDVDKLTLDELEQLNPTMQELSALQPIIKED